MERKYNQYPLNFKGAYYNEALNIITKLYKIPRTGWKDRNVKNPESVGEHTDELVILSEKFFDIPGLSKMLKIHDWPESDDKVGDIRTDNNCPEEKRWSKEEKYRAELQAMQVICLRFDDEGKKILELWLEFEEKITARSKIADQLDKFQAIKKAIKYQIEGQPVIAQEFIDHDGDKIKHPILCQMLNQAIKNM